MRGETKVTYLKNDKVKLVMSGDEYKNLLEGNNELKMQQNLGFMRRKDRPYGGYVLSNHPEADS